MRGYEALIAQEAIDLFSQQTELFLGQGVSVFGGLVGKRPFVKALDPAVLSRPDVLYPCLIMTWRTTV